MDSSSIRNFCIIAHIDHGKSTLADRLLEITGTVAKRDMQNQILDQMDIERERGITIKLAPATMAYVHEGKTFVLNLIDTPGHVDFSYEVSRSLASVEGAILLVDATQGIQAQTLTNLYLGIEANLHIIPVVNKIDLPNAQTAQVLHELAHLLGVSEQKVLKVSAKTGAGVTELLHRIITDIPPPQGKIDHPTRALIFDSLYDEYKGVVAYVRIIEGQIMKHDSIHMVQANSLSEVLEVGQFIPKMISRDKLIAGQIGYVVTGMKKVSDLRVGDTMGLVNQLIAPLPGYKELQPMVFAGFYANEGNEYHELRDALEKLSLNDASLKFEPDHSPALGFGFRCGFLGLLHLDVVAERLKREHDLNVIITVPSVAFHVFLNEAGLNAYRRKHKSTLHLFKASAIILSSALDLPDISHIEHIEEPWVTLDIVTPKSTIGNVYELLAKSHGEIGETEYLDEQRIIIHAQMPLASILVDFYDKLKSATSGYASYHYDILGYRETAVVCMDIMIAGDRVDALSSLVREDEVDSVARTSVESLKGVLPQQLFEIKIQACLGGRVIASSRISPLRKDVTAKLYGGDVTRKRKLLEKQKKGKKRMMKTGKLDIPHEAYLSLLKR